MDRASITLLAVIGPISLVTLLVVIAVSLIVWHRVKKGPCRRDPKPKPNDANVSVQNQNSEREAIVNQMMESDSAPQATEQGQRLQGTAGKAKNKTQSHTVVDEKSDQTKKTPQSEVALLLPDDKPQIRDRELEIKLKH